LEKLRGNSIAYFTHEEDCSTWRHDEVECASWVFTWLIMSRICQLAVREDCIDNLITHTLTASTTSLYTSAPLAFLSGLFYDGPEDISTMALVGHCSTGQTSRAPPRTTRLEYVMRSRHVTHSLFNCTAVPQRSRVG